MITLPRASSLAPVLRLKTLLPEQSDVKYTTAEEVLRELNVLFKTSLAIEPLRSFLDKFIDQGLDFGAIYARLRSSWPTRNTVLRPDEDFPVDRKRFNRLEEELLRGVSSLERQGESDAHTRESSLTDEAVYEPSCIKPRRLWDLLSNRVIPFHYHYSPRCEGSISHEPDLSFNAWLGRQMMIYNSFYAVSHSWTAEMDKFEGRTDTSVNGNEWPVPVPSGITLEGIRSELLHLGAEYVWLDVLCIRQVSLDPAQEELRKKEWMVDIPTIGVVFDRYAKRVIRYMNGLGRIFESFGWNNPRHWLNRAWTLQEVKEGSILGGVPENSWNPLEAISTDTGERFKDLLRVVDVVQEQRLQRDRNDLDGIVERFPTIVYAMRRRFSKNPLDKVFGVAMIFCERSLPLYSGDMDTEAGWEKCVKHFPSSLIGTLLFDYFVAGNGNVTWRPSWSQLMEGKPIIDIRDRSLPTDLDSIKVDSNGVVYYDGRVMEARFTPCTGHGWQPRRGRLIVRSFDGNFQNTSIYEVRLNADQSLEEKDYVFVGNGPGSSDAKTKWIACTRTIEDSYLGLQKVTVITMEDKIPFESFPVEECSIS